MSKDIKFKQTEIGEIPEEWEIKEIGEYFEVCTGNGIHQSDRTLNGPYPIMGANGIIGYSNEFLVDGEYILTGRVGTLGEVTYKTGKFWISDNSIFIGNGKKGNLKFLHYYLKTFNFQALNVGSTQPLIKQSDIKKIKFPFPVLSEQRAIAKVLSDLDEKIELNRQMNKTLESIAQAIFKRWFVDFEFPGCEKIKFTDGLPEGWREGKLIEACDIVMGQSPPGETYNESGDGVVFYQGNRDFGFRFPTPRVYCTAPTRIAEAGDVLISVRAPVGALNITLERCAIGRGVAALRMKQYSNGFLLCFLSARQDLWDRFNSEGTVFGCLNKTEFHKIVLTIPSDVAMKQFDVVIKPIEEMIRKNELEIRVLGNIRDSLLPRLMSGKIRVN